MESPKCGLGEKATGSDSPKSNLGQTDLDSDPKSYYEDYLSEYEFDEEFNVDLEKEIQMSFDQVQAGVSDIPKSMDPLYRDSSAGNTPFAFHKGG